MIYDLRWEFFNALKLFGYSDLEIDILISKAYSDEQRQLKLRTGDRKVTYVSVGLGQLVFGITTVYFGREIEVQDLVLSGPLGKKSAYHQSPDTQSLSKGWGSFSGVAQKQAINEILTEAFFYQLLVESMAYQPNQWISKN